MKTEIKTRKTVPLCGGAEAHVNLLTGENAITFTDITDSDMGVTISHVLQQNGSDNNSFCCGANMRLNLHETFVKNEDTEVDAYYIYTDSMGDSYAFKEYYNYVEKNGTKNRIADKTKITVLEDGNLIYDNGTTIYSVEREVVTYDGLKASTKLEGVKNIENYEQRIDELRQAEEQYDSYKKAFLDYVICDTSGNIVTEIETPSYESIKSFANTIKADDFANLVLTKSEALNLRLLCMSESHISRQTGSAYLTKLTKTNTRTIDKMIADLNETKQSFDLGKSISDNPIDTDTMDATVLQALETLCDYVIYNANGSEGNEFSGISASCQNNEITIDSSHLENGKMFDKYFQSGVTLTQFVLHRNEKENLLSCFDQLNQISKQKEHLSANSAGYIERLLEYYDKCLDSEIVIKNLKLQAPVNFIMSEDSTKGFNENGDLVVIYNKKGNYVAVDYENCYDGTTTLRRIRRVYDDKEREITFAYNHKNYLSEIIDSKGRTVRYEYVGSSITYYNVIFPNEYTLKFYFDSENVQITDNYRSRYLMKATDGKLSEIIHYSSVGRVYHGDIELNSEGYVELSRLNFSCGTIATITDDENDLTSIYVFDTDTERLINFFEEKNGVVSKAEKYELTDLNTKIYTNTKAKRTSLYSTPYASFVFEGEDYSQRTVSVFNYVMSDKNVVHDGDIARIEYTEYTYTPNDQISREVTAFTIEQNGTVLEKKTQVVLYEYNSVGALLRKQSYTEGEEYINGIDIEEHVYDKNGCEIKSVIYNSLDPSSKFYTEREYDENGNEIGQLDQTGKHKTVLEYDESRVYPNGSKLSYGSGDIDGNTAITMSTEDGEENSIQILHTNGLATKVKSGEDEYLDSKGRETLVTLNGVTLAQCSYTDGDTYKTSVVVEKGTTTTTTDSRSRETVTVAKDVGDNSKAVVTMYNKGNAVDITEYSNGETLSQTVCTYDELDRVLTRERTCNGEVFGEEYSYDKYGNVSQKVVNILGNKTTNVYTYSADSKRKLTQVTIERDNLVITPKTDSLGRSTGKAITADNVNIDESTISYIKYGSHATKMPASITYADGSKISYKYDNMGNICKVYEDGILAVDYEYDALGRLVRENNKKTGQTYAMKYDNKGNILASGGCQYTHQSIEELETTDSIWYTQYEYDNSGRLAKYGSLAITYMDDGRCSSYKGYSIAWNGKEMVGYGSNTFTYDATGRRITKNSIEFTYDSNGRLYAQSNGIIFIYDHEALIGFKYSGDKYFYRKDILGNIIAILDSTGAVVVKYVYDAWGRFTITGDTTIANINPYRYRGYYFDSETSLYFLKTRYYDPDVGRFISIDDVAYIDPETIGGTNLYAYCNNNPVMNVDPNGKFFLTFLAAVGISALFGAIDGGITAVMSGQNFWKGFAAGAISGAIGGIVSLVPVVGGVLSRGVSSMAYNVLNEIFQTGTFDINNIGLYVFDVSMDILFSSFVYANISKSFPNRITSSVIGGIVDGLTDVIQTYLYLTPQALRKMRNDI